MTTVVGTIPKDPNAVLTYSISWEDWLEAGESIESSEWFVDSGDVEIGENERAPTTDGTVCTVWLLAGTDGTEAIVTNRVVVDTDPTKSDDRSIKIKVRHR